jgi:hypothetical protein
VRSSSPPRRNYYDLLADLFSGYRTAVQEIETDDEMTSVKSWPSVSDLKIGTTNCEI